MIPIYCFNLALIFMQPNRFQNDLLLHNEYQTKIERLPCLIVLSVNRMISIWSIDLPQNLIEIGLEPIVLCIESS